MQELKIVSLRAEKFDIDDFISYSETTEAAASSRVSL